MESYSQTCICRQCETTTAKCWSDSCYRAEISLQPDRRRAEFVYGLRVLLLATRPHTYYYGTPMRRRRHEIRNCCFTDLSRPRSLSLSPYEEPPLIFAPKSRRSKGNDRVLAAPVFLFRVVYAAGFQRRERSSNETKQEENGRRL